MGYGETNLIVYTSAEAALGRCVPRTESGEFGESRLRTARSSPNFYGKPTSNFNAHHATAFSKRVSASSDLRAVRGSLGCRTLLRMIGRAPLALV